VHICCLGEAVSRRLAVVLPMMHLLYVVAVATADGDEEGNTR
jgi:hypothetical protein